MNLLRSHPAISFVLDRKILLDGVLHFEIVVSWKDDRLNSKSYFIWPTQREAIESALRAANNRKEIINNLFNT